MMSAPREIRCRSMPNADMVTNTAARTSGIESATTAPARRPSAARLTAKDDGDGLPQRLHEVGHGMLDRDRLIGEKRGFDADRQIRLDLRHGALDVSPEGEHVAALAHRDGEPDAVASVDPKHRLRRIGGAARDAGDVAEADHPSVGDEIDRQDVPLGPEGARDADEDLLFLCLHLALGRDGVLGVECGDQRGAVDSEPRQLPGRELHVDALVLRAKDVDLGDVRQLEELLANVLDVVPQLPLAESVRGEAVDDAVGVAELVVEAGPDDAFAADRCGCRRPSCAPDTRCPAR